MRFATTAATESNPIGGGGSNGLVYRVLPADAGGPRGPPPEPPKTGGTSEEAAGSADKKPCGFRYREHKRETNPGHAFFA